MECILFTFQYDYKPIWCFLARYNQLLFELRHFRLLWLVLIWFSFPRATRFSSNQSTHLFCTPVYFVSAKEQHLGVWPNLWQNPKSIQVKFLLTARTQILLSCSQFLVCTASTSLAKTCQYFSQWCICIHTCDPNSQNNNKEWHTNRCSLVFYIKHLIVFTPIACTSISVFTIKHTLCTLAFTHLLSFCLTQLISNSSPLLSPFLFWLGSL